MAPAQMPVDLDSERKRRVLIRRVMEIHAEHGFTDLEIELRQMMEDPACGAQVPQQASAA